MAINFVNLTQHKIVLNDLVLLPSRTIARVETEQNQIAEFEGISIDTREFGDVEGLPDQQGVMMKPGFCTTVWVNEGGNFGDEGYTTDRKIYIVSSLVLSSVPHRSDVAAPDTGQSATRDKNGNIIKVSRLIMNKNAYQQDDDCAF